MQDSPCVPLGRIILRLWKGSMERSLVILKPDAVQRGLVGTILGRLETRGLKIVGMKLMLVDEARARRHYDEHKDRPFFPGLISYITSGPVVVLVVAGENVVKMIRDMVGKTKPFESPPGTIRGDFAIETGRNLIHASDSPESGEREVPIFFETGELISEYERSVDRWIFE